MTFDELKELVENFDTLYVINDTDILYCDSIISNDLNTIIMYTSPWGLEDCESRFANLADIIRFDRNSEVSQTDLARLNCTEDYQIALEKHMNNLFAVAMEVKTKLLADSFPDAEYEVTMIDGVPSLVRND